MDAAYQEANRQELAQLDEQLRLLEAEAYTFGYSLKLDATVRMLYHNAITEAKREIMQAVMGGKISVAKASAHAFRLRETIRLEVRGDNSGMGHAFSIMAQKGLTFRDRLNRLAAKHGGAPFKRLLPDKQAKVLEELIVGMDKSRKIVNRLATAASALGRGLLLLSYGLMVWKIVEAEDKVTTAKREGFAMLGGLGGSVAVGAVLNTAGGAALCALSAPVCLVGVVAATAGLAYVANDIAGMLFPEDARP